MTEFDSEQREILLGFLEEGREMLDEVEPLLIELEKLAGEAGEVDYETINTVFRLFHSLKGGAGFLDLRVIADVTHNAETLLDLFRKGEAQLRSEHIDLWTRTCDFLRMVIDDLEEKGSEEGHEAEAGILSEALIEYIDRIKSGEEPAADAEPAETPSEVEASEDEQAGKDWEAIGESVEEAVEAADDDADEEEPEEAVAASADDLVDPKTGQLLASPEMVQAFVSEATEQLDMAEEALLALEKDPEDSENVNQAFRAFHSFKGNAGFLGYSDFQTLGHHSEAVLDQLRTTGEPPDNKVVTLLLEIIDFLRGGVEQVSQGRSDAVPATSGLVHLLEDAISGQGAAKPKAGGADAAAPPSAPKPTEPPKPELPEEQAAPVEPPPKPQPAGEQTPTVEPTAEAPSEEKPGTKKEKAPSGSGLTPADAQKALSELNEQARASGTPPEPQKSDRTPEPKLEPTPKDKIQPTDSSKPGETSQTVEQSNAAPKADPGKGVSRQSVRVDVEKLDLLLDLIGELVIIEAMVAQSPDIKELDVPLEKFERAVIQLDKLTRELQDIATSIRMIPLAGTFRRMMRLVRDVSQKAGKKVDLEIVGEDTEVDKTVIEQITDPLVHIIRNSVDHGIELPDVREASGKPRNGKVILEAKYVGGEVWILIKDNGRGLHREKILNKALERGIISGDGAGMRDEEVWQLIFQPGFSTADQVTEVSGRGVGMDVVRRNIENIRGKVDVRSVTGEGTTVILRIPLTLAIIDGMLVRVGETTYVIPIVAIQRSLLAEEENITQLVDGQEVMRIRDKLLPAVRLSEFFGVEAQYEDLTMGTTMVVEHDGRQVCLLVDEILGQHQVVIKGLSEYIGQVGDVHGISGCTILGDGTISLIIDVAGLIDTVETVSDSAIDLETVSSERSKE
ncbi:chemotaxis protein CheA [bacterium]|nr:chemotaxis protein CheA [bacterium]